MNYDERCFLRHRMAIIKSNSGGANVQLLGSDDTTFDDLESCWDKERRAVRMFPDQSASVVHLIVRGQRTWVVEIIPP